MLLVFASVLLLGVIALQNILIPALRTETISDGLFTDSELFWLQDTAYAVLAYALASTFWNTGLVNEILSITTAGALMLTAFTNTCKLLVDKIKPNLHVKLHTLFTIVMFLSVLALEFVNDKGWWTWLSIATIALPAAIIGGCQLFKTKLGQLAALGGSIAEKLAVLLICCWLISWS